MKIEIERANLVSLVPFSRIAYGEVFFPKDAPASLYLRTATGGVSLESFAHYEHPAYFTRGEDYVVIPKPKLVI